MSLINSGNGQNAIVIDGVPRVLAAVPRPMGSRPSFLTWSEAGMPVLPEDQWIESDLSWLPVKIKNQLSHGSCTGHGNTSALETSRAIAGLDYVELSATFPYAFNNRGQDQGAITSEVTAWMAQNGTCPFSMCGTEQIFPRQIPDLAEAQRVARRFRIGRTFAVESWAEVGSALSRGFAVVISLCVGNGWENIDSEGMPPASRGYANHCIYVRSLKRRSSNARGGSQWKAEMPNSWGTRWANNGIAFVTKEHFDNSRMGDHVAIQTALLDPEDADGPHWN